MPDLPPADDTLVTDLVRQQFPSLAPVRVTGRYQGMDNYAVEVNEEWIFRFPQRTEGESFLRMELDLLPRLEPVIPVPIPRYEWVGRPVDSYPILFAGYRKLPGVPAILLDPPPLGPLSQSLFQILTAILSFPADVALRSGVYVVPENILSTQREEELETLERVRPALPEALYQRVLRAVQDAAEIPPYDGPPRFHHADISPEHLLIDPETGQITGLIDWTDASIGDPALEFSYLWEWLGEPLIEAILAHGQGEADAQFRERIRFYGVCTALEDLSWGLETGRDVNRNLGLAALKRAFGAETANQ